MTNTTDTIHDVDVTRNEDNHSAMKQLIGHTTVTSFYT